MSLEVVCEHRVVYVARDSEQLSMSVVHHGMLWKPYTPRKEM